ncbi:hypothetical protein KGF54_003264 [Candida jiufengensis]|uniref:uncharacterized protein n=1 Tax=Candida jiufengensis TaxID=497108 RepID=UPI0022244D1E|nr:uncharacterized protein KGF54_003264 [Candida jiufengensis]KAI5952397.1 hypothetical protein KGF54_003264 [Candida jiufengensis]
MIEIYNRIGVKFSDEFISEYLTFLSSSNKLVIKNFEDLVNFKINDTLVSQFNDYIEALFENHLPEVHCYENLEYSIDRIQLLINNILSKVNITSLSINSMLTLFKLNEEFLSVNRCEQSNESNSKLVRNLEAREKQFLEYVKNENMEESIVESLLCTLKLQNSSLLAPFTKPIQSNDKFSEILKFQAKIFVKNIKEEELLNHPKSLEISEDNFEKLISTISNTLPTLIQPVVEFYTNEGLELTPIIYKHILDQLIQKNHYHQAIKTFQESTQKVSWSESINNPTITKTLNDLIQCVCSNLPIRESFPLFQKIKANLNQQQINIDSINVLTSKMLDQNLVGDTIELLKRELPDLKNNLKKLPIDKSYGKKYLQLFNTIHDYVISNESDTTIKNNWYLFIQLYKYFNIPEPTILPTLKFFCSHKRWNSALLIFTKMCDLNQLHGHHNYPPPSKQIYSYLLKEFGDNLYEEGVIEIHDWLKMDTSIDSIGLELNNILMNSYCNLQDVSKVRDLFNSAFAANQINESSAIILLKAYTYNDLNYVEKFYNNLSQFGLEPNYEIYKQYIIAYAYYGQVEKAFELLEEEDEFEVNEDLLINLYNFCYIADQQVKIPELASERYPEIWSNVVSSGLLINSDGYTNEKFLVDGKEIKSIESIES